ncbi:MAG TPA: biotin/lipoyl-containing protein [Anaerolineales bacterium]|nr:biotin/lipoyl-containing protein [Anaerolineales bacterium]
MKYFATIGDQQFEVEIKADLQIEVDNVQLTADFQSVADQPIYSLILDGASYEASIYTTETGIQVLLHGQLFEVQLEDERQQRLRQSSSPPQIRSGDIHIKAPMPGVVIDIPVEEGQEVAQGDNVIILESMKMQNEIKAPRDGTVNRLRVKAGEKVDQNQIMLILS